MKVLNIDLKIFMKILSKKLKNYENDNQPRYNCIYLAKTVIVSMTKTLKEMKS